MVLLIIYCQVLKAMTIITSKFEQQKADYLSLVTFLFYQLYRKIHIAN
jgi:hypothetical protein